MAEPSTVSSESDSDSPLPVWGHSGALRGHYYYHSGHYQGADNLLDRLDDLQLENILDLLANPDDEQGGLECLASFICSFKRVWLLEKTHNYKNMRVYPEADAPCEWLLSRRGRIGVVNFGSIFGDDGDDHYAEYLNTFEEAGFKVDFAGNKAFPNKNIIDARIFYYGFSWTQVKNPIYRPDAIELSEMLSGNPDLKVTVSTYENTRLYDRWNVLRRISDAEQLKTFSHRIDMTEFDLYCRTFDIYEWAQEAFPSARVHFANPAWYSSDDSEYTDDEEFDD